MTRIRQSSTLRRLLGVAILGWVGVAGLACENLDRYGPEAGGMAAPELSAVAASSTAITLSWTLPAGAEHVRVFRDGNQVDFVSGTGLTDQGREPASTYTYTVIALDGLGRSSPASAPATATTLNQGQSDDAPPSVPTGLTAVAASSSSIALAWEPSTDDVGVLGYRIYRDGAEIGLSAGPQYTDLGLTASTQYTYTVAAFDGAAHVSAPAAPASATTLATGVSDTQSPSTPLDLNAVPASSSAITLTWSASTDDVGVLGYRVYRGGVEIGTTSGTTFDDTGLSPSTAYTYTVAAYDAANHLSAPSDPATATTLAAGQSDTDPPTTPNPVVAVASGPSGITVSWGASTDNVGVLGYRIYRDGVEIATTTLLIYADGGLAPNTSYTYTVTAFDAAGNESLPSAGAAATTLPIGTTDTDPPSVPGGLGGIATSISITLSWNASTDNVGVSGYVIYRDGVQIGTSVGTTFSDLGLCASESFSYTVAARDAAGNFSAQSLPAVITTLHASVSLGAAASFGALGGTGVSVLGLLGSQVTGNVGSSPGISILGLPLLNIIGGVLHLADATAASAQVDLAAAITAATALPVCAGHDLTGQVLGGLSLGAGVYVYSSAANLTGTITLDAGGDPNAVFVIVVQGNLTAAAASQVALINGAQAANVFWVVSGATTVGAGATLRGNVLGTGSITLATNATLLGRALSRTGGVSLTKAIAGL
jgi:chitodextrinase